MSNGRKIKRIGLISTRFQGTDGVSLETEKWVEVLERLGYKCFFYAGLSDWDPARTMIVPEAFFDHHRVKKVQEACFGVQVRSRKIAKEIHELRVLLKKTIYEFIEQNKIDLIIVENALSIPMNIPFGIALTEIIAETAIPTIGHHHDFHWERERFIINCVNDYIKMAFPPSLPSIEHVVINSQANKDISYRRGLSPHVIPNVLDFATPAPVIDEYNKNVRKDLGLKPDDIFFLQPTRVIARKGIDHAIEAVHRLNNPKVKLVITHQTRDEGKAYEQRVRNYARMLKVPLFIKPEIISNKRGWTANGKKIYTLWDIYPHADFVTYPSTYEGFGNAFLEAVYFKKPILVNRYSIYQRDIEPLGFECVEMDTYINEKSIRNIQAVLDNNDFKERMVKKNYQIAQEFFSYEVLEYKLKNIIIHFEGL